MRLFFVIGLAVSLVVAHAAEAHAYGNVAARTALSMMRSAGYRAAAQGMRGIATTMLSRQLTRLGTRHGIHALRLARVSGPNGMRILASVGDNGVARLASTARTRGLVNTLYLMERPQTLKLVVQHGDEAASALLKHPGLAADAIEKFGSIGAQAIDKLDKPAARQFTKFLVDQSPAQAPKLVEIIEKYGTPAMNFIWNNKGALAVTTGAAAFYNDPEPFINGTKTLLVEPVTVGISKTIEHIGPRVDWNWVVMPIAIIMFMGFGGVGLIWRIRRQWSEHAAGAQISPRGGRASERSGDKT
ncbi:MAG: hypothetical protein ABL901_18725 [Hyphomicrobiaceae bacterium]